MCRLLPILACLSIGLLATLPSLGAESLTVPQHSEAGPSGGWAFKPLAAVPPPEVQNGRWARNGVDRFLLKEWESRGLIPARETDRRTLIRRGFLDLLGVPPTPEDVRAFCADPAADPWPTWAARLLADPRHGERWARHWLDVARFAESSGFEHDYDRPNAYHYRDFVIRALNQDMPYDQFVRWQLAGDEFEPGNPEALMATGFLGAGVFPTQITANEVERTRYDAMDDMLATTGSAMLGLTLGCARCHDHKFDPISTRDYARMLSTFTTTVRSEVELDLEPGLNQRARAGFDREHAELNARLAAYEASELPRRFEAWLRSGASATVAGSWEAADVVSVHSRGGATFTRLEDGSYRVGGPNADRDVYTLELRVPTGTFQSLRVEAMADPSLPHGGPGRAENGNIGLSRIRMSAPSSKGGDRVDVRLVSARATFEQNNSSLSVSSALDENPGTGWAVDPRFGTNHAAAFRFETPQMGGEAPWQLRLEFDLNTRHNIGRFRVAVSRESSPELMESPLPEGIADSLRRIRHSPASAGDLDAANRARLLAWWKPQDPGWRERHDRLQSHALLAPKPKLTKVLVCAEGFPALRMHTQGADFFNQTFFLTRGNPDPARGVAEPGVLPLLIRTSEGDARWRWAPPAQAPYSGRRRSFAYWMTDPDSGAGHLLARVMVNRVWQHHFGRGLAATANDFGVQGARPSHPLLLDWLSAEFIRSGWSLKRLHALIVTSSAYRLAGADTTTQVQADPENRWFARREPRRLEAESIRDSLLAVTGVLDSRMFGPGTLDPASTRRSVYFTVKRSQLIPAMQVFDAPEPLVSQGSRPVTTVAPQALLLMNSPHVRAWASTWASRCLESAKGDPDRLIADLYWAAVNREPSTPERTQARAFLVTQEDRYRSTQLDRAKQAAATDLAQVVLSLNEVVYVE